MSDTKLYSFFITPIGPTTGPSSVSRDLAAFYNQKNLKNYERTLLKG
jgi:hypothetical protein